MSNYAVIIVESGVIIPSVCRLKTRLDDAVKYARNYLRKERRLNRDTQMSLREYFDQWEGDNDISIIKLTQNSSSEIDIMGVLFE